FRFTIPYHKSKETPQVNDKQARMAPKSFGNVRRILVVEDNVINQKLTETILSAQGLECIMATNGKKAIEHLKTQAVDLILMDIQMPVMDGYRATGIIRDELKLSTPIIAMTAHALSGEKEKCLQAGMNDYMAKPFKEID